MNFCLSGKMQWHLYSLPNDDPSCTIGCRYVNHVAASTLELSNCILSLGQDVGRSCILVTINNRNIMLDCG